MAFLNPSLALDDISTFLVDGYLILVLRTRK